MWDGKERRKNGTDRREVERERRRDGRDTETIKLEILTCNTNITNLRSEISEVKQDVRTGNKEVWDRLDKIRDTIGELSCKEHTALIDNNKDRTLDNRKWIILIVTAIIGMACFVIRANVVAGNGKVLSQVEGHQRSGVSDSLAESQAGR